MNCQPIPFPTLAAALLRYFICLLAFSLHGQAVERYLIDAWETDKGLPQNFVTSIAQTPDGFLWCGTPSGLARFDGFRFVVFNAATTPALGTGRIRQLLADRRGILWISTTEGGLIRFENGVFQTVSQSSFEGSRKAFSGIADDESGSLWLSSEDGSVKVLRGDSIDDASSHWLSRAPFRTERDPSGRVWLRNRFELCQVLDGQKAPVLEGVFGQYQFLAPSRTEGWWVKMGGLVRLWRKGQWIEERAPPAWENRTLSSALEDQQGQLWIGSIGLGLFRYGPDGSMDTFSFGEGLGSDQVTCLCEDREGSLWVGTNGGGLRRLRTTSVQVYGQEQGFLSSQITSLCEGPEGTLWVGTENDGLHRLAKGKATLVPGSERLPVRSVLQTQAGALWVGASPGGLLEMIDGKLQSTSPTLSPNAHVWCLTEDRKGRLWTGQLASAALAFREEGQWKHLPLPSEHPWDVICISEDSTGQLWVGTDGQGLLCWDGNQWKRFGRKQGLPSGIVRCLKPDADQTLWLGTDGGGLCRIQNGHIQNCSLRNGLPDNTIQFIAEDSQGRFWMSSFQGVFNVPRTQLENFFSGTSKRVSTLNFGSFDGLPSIECSGGFQPAGCRTKSGKFYFPTLRGLAQIDPAKSAPPAPPPSIYLDALSVDGALEDLSGTILSQKATRYLSPGRHRCEIRYAAIQLSAPHRIRFRYRLSGIDKDWIDAGARRFAFYNYLPPGTHSFEVQARSQEGAWNPSGAVIEFHIPPLLWERPIFLASTALGGAVLLAGLVRTLTQRRYQTKLRQVEAQRQLEAERTRIAQDIHDDLGAGLTQIGWLGAMTAKQVDAPESVKVQARKITATAKDMVRSLDEIVWAVRPENDTLQALIDYFGHRVDEFFENSSIRAWFTPPSTVPHLSVPAELRHNFYLSCKEALNNVLKHSNASEVRITLQITNGTLQARITDNGQGFSLGETRGNGLPNMRKRMETLGGSFTLESSPANGTAVKVSIPLPSPRSAPRLPHNP